MYISWREQTASNVIGRFNSTLKRIHSSLFKTRPIQYMKTQEIRDNNRKLKQHTSQLLDIAVQNQYSSCLFPTRKTAYNSYLPDQKQNIGFHTQRRHKNQYHNSNNFGRQQSNDFKKSNIQKDYFVELGSQNSRLRIQNQKLKKKLTSLSSQINQKIHSSDIFDYSQPYNFVPLDKNEQTSQRLQQQLCSQITDLKSRINNQRTVQTVNTQSNQRQIDEIWQQYLSDMNDITSLTLKRLNNVVNKTSSQRIQKQKYDIELLTNRPLAKKNIKPLTLRNR